MLVGELMPLRDRLRRLRTAAGLTQQQLAVKAGLSVSVVVHLEGGRIPDPRMSTLKALAKALGVGLDELAGGGGEQSEGGCAPPEEPPPAQKGRKRGK